MNDETMRAAEIAPSGLVLANPKSLHDPAPMGYSHVAIAPPGAGLVFVAGQTGGADKGAYRDQVRVALASIVEAMRAAGGTATDVAKLTVYSVGHDEQRHADLVSEVRDAFGTRLPPTCTIVPVRSSGTSQDQLVEIEAVGVLAGSASS